MNVFVIGSARHLPQEDFNRYVAGCEALGAQIARAGHSLVICSDSEHTADPHFLRGAAKANSACSVTGFVPSGTDQAAYHAIAPQVSIRLITTEGGWRVSQLRAIRHCDVVLALGGSPRGTTPMIYSAELMERTVVIVPSFGGAAQDAWDYFRGRYYKDSEETLLQTTPLPPLDTWAAGVFRAADCVRKRFKSGSLSNLVPYSMIGVAAIAAWLWAFFSGSTLVSAELILCSGLASASVVGSILRLILRRLGVITAEWSENSFVVAIVLGLLLGFGMLLFAEFASLSITGGAIAIKQHSDLQRILGTLSPLIFASALFVEAAWRRLTQKTTTYFEKH